MSQNGAVVVVGGTRATGLEIVKHYAAAGREIILIGQDPDQTVPLAVLAQDTNQVWELVEGALTFGTTVGCHFHLEGAP